MQNRGGGGPFCKVENRGEGGCSFLGEGGGGALEGGRVKEISP